MTTNRDATPTAPAAAPLSAQNVSKAFGHVQALCDVSFDLPAGKITALLGDNGAGKSTLTKIVSGLYAPDTGTIRLRGSATSFASPRAAVEAGIATVYQDLALVDQRDVAANLFLGREFRRGPFVDTRKLADETRRVLASINLDLPATGVPVGMLSGGQRQAVAVARAIVLGCDIVLMDEPTAALGVTESEKVMRLARDLRDAGKAVLIVSHNLQQIWESADRFLVLHLGQVAGVRDRAETTVSEIVELIVYGRRADQLSRVEDAEQGSPGVGAAPGHGEAGPS
jgi:ABC-type sugar transport system ATPase subunit